MLAYLALVGIIGCAYGRPQDRDLNLIANSRCSPGLLDQLIPHENDCTKFYYCQFGLRSLKALDCVLGMEFSESHRACVPPNLSNCNIVSYGGDGGGGWKRSLWGVGAGAGGWTGISWRDGSGRGEVGHRGPVVGTVGSVGEIGRAVIGEVANEEEGGGAGGIGIGGGGGIGIGGGGGIGIGGGGGFGGGDGVSGGGGGFGGGGVWGGGTGDGGGRGGGGGGAVFWFTNK